MTAASGDREHGDGIVQCKVPVGGVVEHSCRSRDVQARWKGVIVFGHRHHRDSFGGIVGFGTGEEHGGYGVNDELVVPDLIQGGDSAFQLGNFPGHLEAAVTGGV